MKLLPIKWHHVLLTQSDEAADINRKLTVKKIPDVDFPHSVYIIRVAKMFLFEYELESKRKASPVIYIGQGRLRRRLKDHHGWMKSVQDQLNGIPLEIRFCFPKMPDGSAAHKEFEAHLITHFKGIYGKYPMKNQRREPTDPNIDFSDNKTAQIFGHGTGKSYKWIIRRRPQARSKKVGKSDA